LKNLRNDYLSGRRIPGKRKKTRVARPGGRRRERNSSEKGMTSSTKNPQRGLRSVKDLRKTFLPLKKKSSWTGKKKSSVNSRGFGKVETTKKSGEGVWEDGGE